MVTQERQFIENEIDNHGVSCTLRRKGAITVANTGRVTQAADTTETILVLFPVLSTRENVIQVDDKTNIKQGRDYVIVKSLVSPPQSKDEIITPDNKVLSIKTYKDIMVFGEITHREIEITR